MKYTNVKEYITLEDVLVSNNIMVIPGEDGIYFINIEPWKTPEKDKHWYRFSINPFDIDFLKFRIMDQGIIKYGPMSFSKIYTLFKYLNISNNDKYNAKYSNIVNRCFFSGLDFKKCIEEYNKSYYHSYNISYRRFIGIRSNLKEKIKIWLERLFKEYNNFDNSIEYIQEYYKKWVLLVKLIQTTDDSIQNILWKFIDDNDVHSLLDFIRKWKNQSKDHLIDIKFNNLDINDIDILLSINIYNEQLDE